MPDFINKETAFNFEFLDAKACLNNLTEQEQDELLENKNDIEFEPGEIIIKRGIAVSHVLYLIDGLAKIEIVNDGKTTTIGLIQSHSFIGIICCFFWSNSHHFRSFWSTFIEEKIIY